jgi:natural product precursor
MKIKTLNKKLVLNKETISHLDNRQMNNAAGGVNTYDPACYTDEKCPTNPIDCTSDRC